MDLPSFVFLLLSLTSFHPHLATSTQHNNMTDIASLLAFKDQVSDPLGILSTNWTLNTSVCSWLGVTCGRKHNRVVSLKLSDFPLQGTISSHLGNLSFLYHLRLSGSIPETLSQFPRLQILTLQKNYLSGTIPTNLFNKSSLIGIYLFSNNLSGSLPSNQGHFMLHRLKGISLDRNQLMGPIPSNFSQCLDLRILALSFNNFTGTIPAELGDLRKLSWLSLAANQLTGKIPTSLVNLTMLETFQLSQNNLEGSIPKEVGNLAKLEELMLWNNELTSSIPPTLLNCSMIKILDLSINNLTGTVLYALGDSMPLLNVLFIGWNQLSGSFDFITSISNCRNLLSLDLSRNNFDGLLPIAIGNLSQSLTVIDIGSNHIQGNIPLEIGNLSGLLTLALEYNELTGSIPSTVCRLQNLQQMDLSANKIGGVIPSELGMMSRLSYLVLQENKLHGAIPDSVGNITRLQHLFLAGNGLSSNIPRSIWSLLGLTELSLSQNSLYGLLPSDVGNVNNLVILDVSQNQLLGNISSSLGKLQMLTYLDLSSNSFHGYIPESLGGLISVKYLNLSKNFLTGSIPNSLANLKYLASLDLSFNKLEGKIPVGRVFSNHTIPHLDGNAALCGAPQLKFPLCSVSVVSSHSKRSQLLLKYILPSIAFIVVVISCIFLKYAIRLKRKEKTRADIKFPQLAGQRLISYYELVRTTNNFSQDKLIGKGRYGSVFKACLDDGLTAAVKVLNLDVEGASKSFDAECQVLSSVRHRNLIQIISTCSNLEFKALILQFMPTGSLEQWLYSTNCSLSFLQRLNIMVDVSLALEYLHHHHPHVVLHCDLKPSNILLDEEMVAHVSDFGIAKLLLGDSRISASIPGTIGYIAPEYGSTRSVSKMGDVYSFGILLLETFTGRKPSNVNDEELSLREMIHKAYPAALLDILDYNLFNDGSHNGQQSVDPTTVQHCITSIIELGLICSRDSPKERIPMIEVVPRLQKIKVDYLFQFSSA